MSKAYLKMRKLRDELAVLLPCATCGASPGVWCKTKRGIRCDVLHGARSDPVRKFSRAYEEIVLEVERERPTKQTVAERMIADIRRVLGQ